MCGDRLCCALCVVRCVLFGVRCVLCGLLVGGGGLFCDRCVIVVRCLLCCVWC